MNQERPVPVLKTIHASEITTSNENLRTKFKASSIKSLAETINQVGLINPISVEQVGDTYKVIAGKRRHRAITTILNWDKIPAFVYSDLTKEQRASIIYVENLEREDLLKSEELKQVLHMTKKMFKQEAIANCMGKTIAWVRQRQNLRSLHKNCLEEIDNPKYHSWTIGNWATIAALPSDDQKKIIECFWGDEPVNWEDAQSEMVRNSQTLKNTPWPSSFKVGKSDTCKKCPDRTGAQADLFSEDTVLKKDRCLNPDCFNEKLDAWQKKKISDLEKEHDTVVKVTEYPTSSKSNISQWDLDELKLKKPGADSIPAITKDSKIIWIDKKKYEKNHQPKSEVKQQSEKPYKERIDNLARIWLSQSIMALHSYIESKECEEWIAKTLPTQSAVRLYVAFGEYYGNNVSFGYDRMKVIEESMDTSHILETGFHISAASKILNVQDVMSLSNEKILEKMKELISWLMIPESEFEKALLKGFSSKQQPKSWTKLKDYDPDLFTAAKKPFINFEHEDG